MANMYMGEQPLGTVAIMDLKKVETEALIAELERRGYTVQN